jgi:hypothetical protein
VNSKRIAEIGIFTCLFAGLGLLLWHGMQFAADLRRSAAGATSGMEICEFRAEKAEDCTVLSNSVNAIAFAKLVSSLAAATSSVPPGKVPISRERILRIRENASPSDAYSRCYFLQEFEGFPDEYVTEVVMDPGCVFIRKTRAGGAKVSRVE